MAGQGHVHDGDVEDHHELGQADDDQDDGVRRPGPHRRPRGRPPVVRGTSARAWDDRRGAGARRSCVPVGGTPQPASRATRRRRASGHSTASIEKTAESRTVPSAAGRSARSTPSRVHPMRAMAARDRSLRASVWSRTARTPHRVEGMVQHQQLGLGVDRGALGGRAEPGVADARPGRARRRRARGVAPASTVDQSQRSSS